MKKKVKTLLFSGICLVVLIGIVIILALTEKPLEITGPPKEDEKKLTITLADYDPDALVSIGVKNSHGEYIIGEFGDVNAPLDSGKLDVATRYACSVKAQELVEKNAKDFEKYGLGSDAIIMTATFENNDAFEIYIGDPTPTSEDMSYIRVKDSDAVYAVWSYYVNQFREPAEYYISLNVTPTLEEAGIPKIERLIIERKGELKHVIEAMPGIDEAELLTSLNPYKLIEPVSVVLDFGASVSVVEGMFGLRADKVAFVGEYSDDDFGFDEPLIYVEMTVSEVSVADIVITSLTIGGFNGEYYYVRYSEIPHVIYLFSGIYDIFNFNIESIMAKNFHMPLIYSVGEFTVETFGENPHNLHFRFTGEQGGKEAYFLQDELIEEKPFKQFYTFCLMVTGDELYKAQPKFTPEEMPLVARFTYKYRSDNNPGDVIEFYDSGDRRNIIVFNGAPTYSSRTMYTTRLEQNIEAYLNNEPLVASF